MNDKLADTFSLMLKVVFFIVLGVGIYYYMPPQVWEWIKIQAEWAKSLMGIK